jgi:ubiquitin carboxyl-terminal hydrolase 7
LLLFPNGNRTPETISVFLECIDATKKQENDKWHLCVGFVVTIANSKALNVHPKVNSILGLMIAALHRFNAKETDWGFSQLAHHQTIEKPVDGFARPILENNQFTMVVVIKQILDETGVLWHNFAE